MKFENREFEKNIAKSKKSIEELKESMDFEETSKGLEKFADSTKVLGFDALANNVEKLMNKFTGLGTVSEYVLSRIRASLESAAQSMEAFIRSISLDQISVGQGKYDALNKAVMTIVSGGQATEEQAYATMERVIAYTDQTSHNFETMVLRISDLTSRGMGLDEAERLVEAIGNAATYAGQDATNAAMSMGVLSKALSGQFLGYEQFLQLANTSKVITSKWREQAVEAGKAVGTLVEKNGKLYTNVKGFKAVEVTAQNLENTLKSRWLTADVLKRIYENYKFGDTVTDLRKPEDAVDSFGKTAYLTGQRALSLKDAINAIKESVSSGWMETFRYLFGDVTEAAEHFTAFCNRIIESLEKIRDLRNGILRSWANAGGRNSLFRIFFGNYEDEAEGEVAGFMDVLDTFGKIAYKGLVEFFGLFLPQGMRELIREEPGAFAAYVGVMFKNLTDKVQNFMQRINDFFNGEVTVGGESKSRLEVIYEIVQGISAALKFGLDILSGIIGFIGQIGEQLTPAFDTIILFFGKLGLSIYDTEDQLTRKQTITKFFTDLASKLKPVTDGINSVVTSITNLLSLILGLDKKGGDNTKTFEKLGNVLLTLADIFSSIVGPILTFISSVIDSITTLFDGGFTVEKFQEFGKQLGEHFSTMMKSFADKLPESFGFLKNWIYDLFGLWEEGTEHETNSFFTFLHNLFTGKFGNLGELLTSFSQGFSLKDALESGFGFISAWNFLGQLVGFFKGTNLYGVILAFLGVATLAGLISLIKKAKKAVGEVAAFFADVGGNLKQGFLGDYEWFGERMLNISKALALLVACVAVIGSMKPGAMVQGIIGVTLVLAAMLGMYYVMSKLKANYGQQMAAAGLITSITAAIVAITIGLSVLSLAILPLASDWKKMLAAVIGFAAFLTAIGAFIVIMLNAMDKLITVMSSGGKLGEWEGLIKIGVLLIGISAVIIVISKAISVLALALTPLALTGFSGMLNAIIAFAAFLTIFGIFIIKMINALDELAFKLGGGNDLKAYGKMALAMIALSASITLLSVGIGLLAIALIPLAMMSWESMIRAVIGLGVIMLELGAMIKFVTGITSKDKAATLKIAGFAGFAASIGILIMALTPLALMDDNSLIRALYGLTIVLAEMMAVMLVVDKAKIGTGRLLGFAGFAASIGILIFSLIPLASMDDNGIARALYGLAIVLGEMLAVMLIIDKAKISPASLTSFLGFAASIALIMVALIPLSNMTPQGYQQALIGLGAVMLEIIVLMHIIDQIRPDIKTAGSTLMLMLGLAVAMILFSIAFNEVKDVPWENIVSFSAGISILLIAVAGAAKIASGVSLKGILMLSIALAAILGVLSLMLPILLGSIGSSMTSLASRMSMFAQLMTIFTEKMSNVDEGSADKAVDIIKKLAKVFDIMVTIKVNDSAISSFTMSMARLNLVADQLSMFQSRMQNISAQKIEEARSILTEIQEMLDNEITEISGKSNIASLFSTAMYNLGTGMEIFSKHTGTVEDPDSNNAVKLIRALSGCASDLDIIYKMNVDKLTSQLTGLGGAMMIYAQGAQDAQGMTGFDLNDEKSVSIVESAVGLLQAISTSLAANGGIVIPTNMPSTEEFGLYGAQLAALAAALIQFEEAGSGLGTGTDKALEVLTFFRDLKDRLVNTEFSQNLVETMDAFRDANGMLIQQNELEVFGKNIEQLGISLGEFAKSTTMVDEQTGELKPIDYTKATAALDSIASLSTSLPSIGGAVEWITGRVTELGDLAAQIELLGSALGDFHTNTSTFDTVNKTLVPYDFTNSIDFLNAIKELNTKMPHMGGINLRRFFEGDQISLSDLGADLAGLGAGLNVLSASITGENEDGSSKFDAEKAKEAADLLRDTIVPTLQSLKTDLDTVGGIGKFFSVMWSGRGVNFEDISKQLELLGPGLKALGEGVNSGAWNGDVSAVSNAFSALKEIVGMMINFNEYADQLYLIYGSLNGYTAFTALNEFLTASTQGYEDVYGNAYGPIIENIGTFVTSLDEQLSNYAGTMDKMQSMEGRMNVFKIFAEGLNALTNSNITIDWASIGTKLTDEVAASIITGADNVKVSCETLMTGAYNAAQNVEGVDWSQLGLFIGQGIELGVNNAGTNLVTPAVEQMMKRAYDAGKAAIDSNSPSKLFMTLGVFAGEGMAIGIGNTENAVGENASALGEVALDKARDMVALISQIMSEDIDASPTISPVLDLTNIEAGMDEFAKNTSGKSIGIDTTGIVNVAGSVVARSGDTSFDFNTLKPDYAGVYARMDALGQQINQLGSAISQIKIVLNTGVVAGSVTDDVDTNIGRKAFYAGRNF